VARVALINPRISGEARYGRFKDVGSYLPPYGLLSIAAVLEEAGHTVRVLDADSRKGLSFTKLALAVADFYPDVIGLTAYSIGRKSVIKTARLLRRISGAPIVVGGPHVTTWPNDLLGVDVIDFLVYGEGEETMLNLVENSADPRGVIETAKGRTHPPRPVIEDLDVLPFPAFHLLDDLHDYAPMQLLYKKRPVLTLITGRGCPFNCIFCYSVWGRKVRLNSAAYVARLVEYVRDRFGVKEVMFYEDTFCIDKGRVSELCEILRVADLGVSWSCSANVRTLDLPLLKRMKAAGCWLISIGIESGSDKVLEFIKKPARVAEVQWVCAYAAAAGIKLRGFFMLGNPTETRETIRQTIDFAKELPLLTVNFCILQLMPGSEVRKIAHNYGTTDYRLELGSGHPQDALSFVPHGLTEKYLRAAQKRAYREFFLRPIQIWRLLRSVDSWEDVRKYWRLFVTFLKL